MHIIKHMRFISKLHVLFVCIKINEKENFMEHDDIGDAAEFSDDFEYNERTLTVTHLIYGFEHCA